jgi:hypothetical protein
MAELQALKGQAAMTEKQTAKVSNYESSSSLGSQHHSLPGLG